MGLSRDPSRADRHVVMTDGAEDWLWRPNTKDSFLWPGAVPRLYPAFHDFAVERVHDFP